MRAFRKFLQRRTRGVLIAFSLFLILFGLTHILSGRMNYENYWGGIVFAPFTILVGIVLMFIAMFRIDRLRTFGQDKKGRPIRFPADDFKKW